MKIRELTAEDLATRLGGGGVMLPIGPFLTRLRTSMHELVGSVHLLYAHYEVVEQPGELIDFDIRLDPGSRWAAMRGKTAAFFVDGRRVFQPFERTIALPMLEWVINWCVFTVPNQYLILHSAVVERGGRAAILPGEPGAGKSTLCAALSHRGWRLLSDEVAVMRPGTTDLLPVPRPIGLKEQSIEVIRSFAPGAVLGPSVGGTRKGTVAHVQPPQGCVEEGDRVARPGWIVFPRYRAGAATDLAPVTKGFALLRLASDAFNFSTLGAEGFETAADLVEQNDCYELTYGDLEEAVGVFAGLAGC